jgi:pyruvate kinase
MSRCNIDIPIVALTPSVATQRKLALYRNVSTISLESGTDRDKVLKQAEELLVEHKVVSKGDTVVVTWGEPMGKVGGTNSLKITKIGQH